MAKFSRFDPRNKKKDRNKNRSLYKDIKIHEERNETRKHWHKVMWTHDGEDKDRVEMEAR